VIIPNANTWRLLAVLLAIGYASASQNNAAAYLLGFLILSLACVSTVHSWANLTGLKVAAEPIPPVYEGEPLVVPLVLQSTNGRTHAAIRVTGTDAAGTVLLEETPPDAPARAELMLETLRRGRYERLGLEVSTTYPLGFFTARFRVRLPQRFHVYPKPVGDLPLPVDSSVAPEGPEAATPEGDDFAGVREWRLGESMRHIDWRAVARGQPMMTKQWNGGAADRLILDWSLLSGLPTEDRLRQLARWIILAERSSATYELRVPAKTLAFNRGEVHLHACLRELAEFPREEPPVRN
jgi:uncharacterized protein (DUF58 family)